MEQLAKEKAELEAMKQGMAVKIDSKEKGAVKEKSGKKKSQKKSEKSGKLSKSSSSKDIDINDLRANKKLLKSVHKQLKSYQLLSDSSSMSDDDSASDTDGSSSDETHVKRKDATSSSHSESDDSERKQKHRKRKKKSGLSAQSKQKTLYPQDCPQSKLQLEYSNKSIKFDDLKYHQFVAGEMEIIVDCKNKTEKTGRLNLLKKISYYYELYDWKALLQFYAAWIRRIESGQSKWSDDPSDIETPLLASAVRSKQYKTNKTSGPSKSPVVWFCSDFQKKKCSFSGPHDKVIKGMTRHVQHICANCLLKDNKQLPHAESDPSCPNYEH